MLSIANCLLGKVGDLVDVIYKSDGVGDGLTDRKCTGCLHADAICQGIIWKRAQLELHFSSIAGWSATAVLVGGGSKNTSMGCRFRTVDFPGMLLHLFSRVYSSCFLFAQPRDDRFCTFAFPFISHISCIVCRIAGLGAMCRWRFIHEGRWLVRHIHRRKSLV